MSERGATRLYIPGSLARGAAIALDPRQTHRLRNVLRLASGAAVAAFNESAGEWLCHLAEESRGRAVLLPEHQLRTAEAEPDLWLLFAPIKRSRLDWLVEKATELGAAVLLPVLTARTQPERVNRERLRAQAIAAAEQQIGGRAIDARLENENGAMAFVVEVARDNSVQKVFVDLQSGNILKVVAADSEDGEHDND